MDFIDGESVISKGALSHCYLEGIEGAAEDQQAVVAQRGDHGQVGGVADEVDLPDAGVVVDHLPGKTGGNRKWQQVGLFPVGRHFFSLHFSPAAGN